MFHNVLKGRKIRHIMHPKMPGNPDVALKDEKKVIFIDGDFWHGRFYPVKLPKSNKRFWRDKIERNIVRDIVNTDLLERLGYEVERIWEGELA